jgi:hypothetical protein
MMHEAYVGSTCKFGTKFCKGREGLQVHNRNERSREKGRPAYNMQVSRVEVAGENKGATASNECSGWKHVAI